MVKAHTECILLELFLGAIRSLKVQADGKIERHLFNLFRIAGLKSIIANSGELYLSGFLHPLGLRMARHVL